MNRFRIQTKIVIVATLLFLTTIGLILWLNITTGEKQMEAEIYAAESMLAKSDYNGMAGPLAPGNRT